MDTGGCCQDIVDTCTQYYCTDGLVHMITIKAIPHGQKRQIPQTVLLVNHCTCNQRPPSSFRQGVRPLRPLLFGISEIIVRKEYCYHGVGVQRRRYTKSRSRQMSRQAKHKHKSWGSPSLCMPPTSVSLYWGQAFTLFVSCSPQSVCSPFGYQYVYRILVINKATFAAPYSDFVIYPLAPRALTPKQF